MYSGGNKWHDSAGGNDVSTAEQLDLINKAWQGTFCEIFDGARYSFNSDSIQFGKLTYAEVLNRAKTRYSKIDPKYQQDFIKQIELVLKNMAQEENLSGLDKKTASQDLAID